MPPPATPPIELATAAGERVRVAITREVSSSLDRCELTHRERQAIDVVLAAAQHRQYQEALEEAGCRVVALPGDPRMPDCVFVEDVAIVLEELAILTRPGAASRRAEGAVVRAALEPFRPLAEIRAPGVLDGGDVLRVGRTLYVGLSTRTNREALDQLARIVAPAGYEVRPVAVDGCLHLKSAVTEVADGTLLVQPHWVDSREFSGLERIAVDPGEPHAANALRIGDVVLYSSAYPRTRERLEARGLNVRTVDQSELAKAEGGLTCCSLIFEARGVNKRSRIGRDT